MANITFSINDQSQAKILSSLAAKIAHTYTGEIKRTLTGRVSSMPVSYRTIGLDVVLLGKVVDLTDIINMVQVPKVKLSFTEPVYECQNGWFSCTGVDLQRIKDANDVMGSLTVSFVSIGVPIISRQGDKVHLVAPDVPDIK